MYKIDKPVELETTSDLSIMNDNLKENLNQLRSLRMRKFGNVAYQKFND